LKVSTKGQDDIQYVIPPAFILLWEFITAQLVEHE
jgi:hypothetical protein